MSYQSLKATDGLQHEELHAWAARIVETIATSPQTDMVARVSEIEAFAQVSRQIDPAVLESVSESLNTYFAAKLDSHREALHRLMSTEAAASLESLINSTVSNQLLMHALHFQGSFALSSNVPAANADAQESESDPDELLSANQLAEALGNLSDETVRLRERNGELFSILKPGRMRGREYPAFQAWPDIAGKPLESVMGALGASRSTLARGFFSAPNELLGGSTPVEVMVGRPVTRRPVSREAELLLSRSPEKRLEAVVEAAKAHAGSAETA